MTSPFASPVGLGSAQRDIPAGLVVFLVALPLCLGIALASGAPLFSGIIAGIVGGLIVGLFSGSELSVSGPAAGLAVIVAAAIAKLGSFETFALAVALSGLLQIALGAVRAGGIGDYIPNSVIKGMLAAIGVVIILKQLPHALGDDLDFEGDESFAQADHQNTFTEVLSALGKIRGAAVLIAGLSLCVLFAWDAVVRRLAWARHVPPALLCVFLGVGINEALTAWWPEAALRSADDHLVSLPVIGSPADLLGVLRFPNFSAFTQSNVWITAVTLAIVGSIETLLSLEASDKLDPEKRISDPNRELRAQGIGNLVSGLIGGLPITSVIVRSSANVYAGARSRLSTLVHGAMLLLAVVLLSRWLNHIPLAALAAVLIAVGYKLASVKVLKQVLSEGWPQFLPFFVTLAAIVFTDLLRGIACGLLVGLFFVIRSNHHAATTLVSDGKDWMLRFNKDMSFVNKQELKRRLRGVPDRTHLIVDGTKALYIDRDIYETLQDFEASAGFRGITLEYHNLAGKQITSA
jgi:MFS superfamily sulfate permease-like transporter